MRIIRGDGRTRHPRLFICGERPGGEEHARGVGFVGPAGEELWSRLWRVCKVERSDCWVTNLVKTFSMDPPSSAEIARDAPMLRAELRKIQPAIIVTVGYHAARWFLPQYADWPGDYFHGLPHSTIRCKGAILIPICHSAAALRQPDRFQHQLTTDLEAVRGVLRNVHTDRRVDVHLPIALSVVPCGLASIQDDGTGAVVAGVDTEGSPDDPQAVSLSVGDGEGCCVEIRPGEGTATPRLGSLRSTLAALPALTIHHAKFDWRVLARLGVTLQPHRVHDSMLQAYLLGLPQSLKVLAYRLHHVVMTEYEELIAPIDNANVRRALEAAYERITKAWAEVDTLRRVASHARRRARNSGRKASAGRLHRATANFVRESADAKTAAFAKAEGRAKDQFPKRARSSLAKILGQGSLAASQPDAEAAQDPQQITLRKRWGKSKFSRLASLPPVPPEATWRDVPQQQREEYSRTDAVMHHATHEALWPQVKASGQARVYRIDRAILPFLARNEDVGLLVDVKGIAALSERFAREYASVCKRINKLAGRDVNPLAAEDMSETIFEDWGVTPTRRTATGFHTTQDKYLKARKDEHEGVPLVIEARQINKMRGTYVERLPNLLRDSRYHPDWKYTRTTSARAAEQIILLIPKHSDRGRAIRRCFVADDGCELVSCDLSQIELRSFAHLTQEPKMLKALRDGVDLHALTAYELLGAPQHKDDQDESLHRLPAKTLNFGILMGMTPYGLLDQLLEQGQAHWNLESVEEFHSEWFRKYKVAAAWVEAQKQYARRHGHVVTREGRVIRLSGIWSTNERIATEFERKAHAIPVQEDAANIAKRWIARVWKHVILPRQGTKDYCEPWVWVHDDITVCVRRRIAKTVAEEMLALVPQDLCVPVRADAKRGLNWAPYNKKTGENIEGLQ